MKYKFGIGLMVLGLAMLFFSFSKQMSGYFELTKNLEIFSNVYKEVNANYVEDLDHSHLMKIGIDAMLGSLDPYTVFISENQVERSRYMAEGRYDGVGMEIEEMDEKIVVTFVYSGFGAHDAGIMAGDIIEKIEGRSLFGFDKEDVMVFMRGASGTKLNMDIYRPLEEKKFQVEVERQDVSVPNVPYAGMVDDGIGYVALSVFTPRSAANILSKIQEFQREGELNGIILDLRDNGGGLLSEAINVSNLFLPENTLVVSTKGKVEEWNRNFNTRGSAFDTDLPVVVLINEKSASASEIVSGVLQDYDRGVLIGQRTYGKGLVQNVRPLSYNTQMRVTTSEYFIPSGRGIQNVKYEDGQPVSIPDSLRAVFQTKNGRTVLDGGGVAPDIEIEELPVPEVITALEDQHLIFKYASLFRSLNDSIAPPGEFNFDDYDHFTDFVKNSGFEFELEAEKILEDLVQSAETGLYSNEVEPQIKRIKKSIEQKKATALKDHQHAIVRLLEEEIVSRYYYQEGKTKQNLLRGTEVQEAIQLLNNPDRYHNILAGK